MNTHHYIYILSKWNVIARANDICSHWWIPFSFCRIMTTSQSASDHKQIIFKNSNVGGWAIWRRIALKITQCQSLKQFQISSGQILFWKISTDFWLSLKNVLIHKMNDWNGKNNNRRRSIWTNKGIEESSDCVINFIDCLLRLFVFSTVFFKAHITWTQLRDSILLFYFYYFRFACVVLFVTDDSIFKLNEIRWNSNPSASSMISQTT